MLKAVLLLIFTVIVWGTQPLAIRVALDAYSINFAAFVRCAAAAVIFGLVFLTQPKRLNALSQPLNLKLKIWLIAGGISLGLATILWNESMSRTTVGAAGVLQLSSIIVLTLFGIIVLSEPCTALRITGLLFALGGTFLVAWNGKELLDLFDSRYFQGNLFAVASGVAWSVCAIAQKLAVPNRSSISVVTPMFAIATLTCIIPAANSPTLTTSFNISLLVALILSGALGMGLGNLFFTEAMRTLSSSAGAAAVALSPIVTVVLAIPLLREPGSAYLLAGAPLISLGVAFMIGSEAAAAAASEGTHP